MDKDGGTDVRAQILKAAQERFERGFVAGTLKDIEKARAKLEKKAETLSGPDASLRLYAVKADLKRLDGMKRKVQGVLQMAKKNLKAQLGAAGFKPDVLGGAVSTSKKSAK